MKNLKFDPKNWDWYAFLDASKHIKKKYIIEACNLAGGWTTCACGQLCNVLPKDCLSAPLDRDAHQLGVDFYNCIEINDWDEAKTTLDKIEKRTIFLLKQPNFIDPKTL
tara:strand:- start:706 stop:1032 length:327 start_codon:yes stop_codon:yes gene_type:complete